MKDTVVICYNWDIQLLFRYTKDTVVVYTKQDKQLVQNNLNQEDTETKINTQLPLKDKAYIANHVLENLELADQAGTLHGVFCHWGSDSQWALPASSTGSPFPSTFTLAGNTKAASYRPPYP